MWNIPGAGLRVVRASHGLPGQTALERGEAAGDWGAGTEAAPHLLGRTGGTEGGGVRLQ